MNVIKIWRGKEAVDVYKKEINENCSKEELQDIDYIEVCQIPNHNIHAFLVYSKSKKAA